MPTFFALFLGFAFGLASGREATLKTVLRRLREFHAARGLRVLDAAGMELSLEQVLDAVRKDLPREQLSATRMD